MDEPENGLALLTDLYELTMAEAYFQARMFEPATFSLFIRKVPPGRGYFVSAGLDGVLNYLESFRFHDDDLAYLKSLGLFSAPFLEYLAGLRFTGSVRAMPEGRVFFRDEPVLEVTAPLIEAQVVETYIIQSINLSVILATKASRCVHAAGGRDVVDFSLRRTQGSDAGLAMARAGWIAGLASTSNVLAGKKYGIPVSGTMAHSFVTSFPDELSAFRSFCGVFKSRSVLILDTYDTISGARNAVVAAGEMARSGHRLRGVRLDSGDLPALSKQVREILDENGLTDAKIFASGGLDEFKIAELLEKGAPIDAFGVGTKMGVSADAPYLDIAYKQVRHAGRPVMKLSPGKRTLVGEKQVFRRLETLGRPGRDTIALAHENLPGEPLLRLVMESGKRREPPEPLDAIRERFTKEFSIMDPAIKDLRTPAEYPVSLSPALAALQDQVEKDLRQRELGES